ncbi:MAG TPA: MFS transporter [Pseudolabrys sp.]|jgi:CP family cyanate transporter-like MFS transporter|nr:MFS transporter [Pseudolabrys sp.]
MNLSCIAHSGNTSRVRVLTSIVLLWLLGTALRFTILAVPPVIPRIHADLGLNATQIGMLTGLPSMLLAIAAVPGSLLIARLGVLPAMTIGLVFTAVGGALRGAVADVAWLYAMTVAMGAGVAVLQVCMPPAVRAWTPHRIGFVTAVYTNGLIIGEILPVALTLPFLLPLFGGSWPADFAFWSAPVAVITVLVLLFAPRTSNRVASAATGRRWWPDWGNFLIWRLGLMLGTVNALYFGTNAFLPDYLNSQGKGLWISAALTGLNVGQLPASILLLLFASRLELKAWPYVAVGALCALATGGVVFGSGPVVVASASIIGFAAAAVLVLALALPPLLARPDDVHRITAAMFTISYSWAVVIPVISGALWDSTGTPQMTFLPMVASSIILMLLAPAIKHVRRVEV